MTHTNRHSDRPGRYLTDGDRLLRIVTPGGWPRDGGFVEVENCASLDVVLMSPLEIRALRPVRTASACRPVAVAA